MSREMTNSEAISNLNHIYGIVSPDIQRSLDVAFKALEEKPQGDLISRSELKKVMDKLFESGGYDSGLVMNTIDNAPTVDKGYDFGYADGHGEGYELGKNSRPKGYWDKVNYGDYENLDIAIRCSECLEEVDEESNFCPNCGADMREGDSDA